MILNALDEILFWNDIDTLKAFIKQINAEYYPHDYENHRRHMELFFKSVIPNKTEFIRRLEKYAEKEHPFWISGRNQLSDDIDADEMIKAITVSSTVRNGERKAEQANQCLKNKPVFWNLYSDQILHLRENRILELTIGAGLGTNAVMKNMTDRDYYMGVDIDFVCAKNADALAKYYGANGLGIAASLWNLPFDDSMFTSVCSNAGLEECREIPTVLKEAIRVLTPGGKLVLHCLNTNKVQSYARFAEYGFSEQEMMHWLKQVRMYASADNVKELLAGSGLKLHNRIQDVALGCVLVFEK